jgi:hypothetical protein
MVWERAPCNSVNHQFRSRCRTPAKPLALYYQFFVKCTSTGLLFSSITTMWFGRPRLPFTARVQRMLVHLVYLVYLVCLVDRTGNSSRGTRQTRKTGQPDRRARARCASTEDHQAPSLPPFCEQEGHLATPVLRPPQVPAVPYKHFSGPRLAVSSVLLLEWMTLRGSHALSRFAHSVASLCHAT